MVVKSVSPSEAFVPAGHSYVQLIAPLHQDQIHYLLHGMAWRSGGGVCVCGGGDVY